MSLLVMRRAQPHDFKRSVVVRVMGLWRMVAIRHGAHRPRLDTAISQSIVQVDLRRPMMRILLTILGCIVLPLTIPALAIVCPDLFKTRLAIGRSGGTNASLTTRFAGHVKIVCILSDTAFGTGTHQNGTSPSMSSNLLPVGLGMTLVGAFS